MEGRVKVGVLVPMGNHGSAPEPWPRVLEFALRAESLGLGLRMRNPALLAKMAATTDDISGGRLTLGVGAGWHDPEYSAFGYPLDHRLGRTEEAFELLVKLVKDGRASADGEWIKAEDAAI